MDREMMGQVLAELIPGDSTEIDEVTLGMLFPPGEAGGVIDQRTRTAATRFAREHGCGFLFDGHSSKSTFLKLPSRWHQLIDNLCTNLGRGTPGTENFQINIDYEISEAEARASGSQAIPFGETPAQRKQEFQEALRKILRFAETAIRRIKKCGLRLCVSSITLDFAFSNHKPNLSGRRELRRTPLQRRHGLK
jgi:hypothetical protein